MPWTTSSVRSDQHDFRDPFLTPPAAPESNLSSSPTETRLARHGWNACHILAAWLKVGWLLTAKHVQRLRLSRHVPFDEVSIGFITKNEFSDGLGWELLDLPVDTRWLLLIMPYTDRVVLYCTVTKTRCFLSSLTVFRCLTGCIITCCVIHFRMSPFLCTCIRSPLFSKIKLAGIRCFALLMHWKSGNHCQILWVIDCPALCPESSVTIVLSASTIFLLGWQ